MKISVLTGSGFIRQNLTENLKNIRDGKNRTRSGLNITEVLNDIGGDTAVILLTEDAPGYRIPELAGFERIIWVLEGSAREGFSLNANSKPSNDLIYTCPRITGKWDESANPVPSMVRAAAFDTPLILSDPEAQAEILFIDDLTEEILNALEGRPCLKGGNPVFPVTFTFALTEAAELLKGFSALNDTLFIPKQPENSLSYRLFSMYLSFLPMERMIYPVRMNTDNRGIFSELLRFRDNGQVSINIARPGNTRGQHWHNSKWEIFIVVSGHGLIEERKIGTDEVRSFEVRGEDMQAVIMLPGYTHSITNLENDRDLVTVMYANELFDPDKPDTYFESVR